MRVDDTPYFFLYPSIKQDLVYNHMRCIPPCVSLLTIHIQFVIINVNNKMAHLERYFSPIYNLAVGINIYVACSKSSLQKTFHSLKHRLGLSLVIHMILCVPHKNTASTTNI